MTIIAKIPIRLTCEKCGAEIEGRLKEDKSISVKPCACEDWRHREFLNDLCRHIPYHACDDQFERLDPPRVDAVKGVDTHG